LEKIKEVTRKRDYYHVTDGEWIVVPKRGYKEQCCDCGLVHKLNFKVNKFGQIEIQTIRDERSTSAVRRAFKFEKDR
jgi:hypothetical protein